MTENYDPRRVTDFQARKSPGCKNQGFFAT